MGGITSNGHDCAGTTAKRPTNVEAGQAYFDTDVGVQLVWVVGMAPPVPPCVLENCDQPAEPASATD